MVISLTLPRMRFVARTKSLTRHDRQLQQGIPETSSWAPTQRPLNKTAHSVVSSTHLHALELEEAEPTWEDAEWQ